MSSEESTEIRQKNELEALEAIYLDDLKDLRKKAAWNRWTPLNLLIKLKPQQGGTGPREVFVNVDLHIICCDAYPNKVPTILLENSKGLSSMLLVQLQEELERKAKEYEGSEMIFELCQCGNEFLYKHNKPLMQSFYHEMLTQQKEKEMQELQMKQLEENRMKEHIMKEVQERQEMLMAEKKTTDEILDDNGDKTVYNRKFSMDARNHSVSENNEAFCDHKGVVLMEFNGRTIKRGRCLTHFDGSMVTFLGTDIETGDGVEICEWKIETKGEAAQIQKQLSNIEQELNYLTKLRHSNLNRYLGFRYEVHNDNAFVYILREFLGGASCFSLFTSHNIEAGIDCLRYLAKGILQALEYLHRNNVVHKNLRDSCVFMDYKGCVKVTDYSIHRRITDLSKYSHGSYGKKTDIYDYAKLLLKLCCFDDVKDDELEIPNTLPNDLCDLLERCLTKNERTRQSASQLLHHSFFHKNKVDSQKEVNENFPIERNISPEIDQNISALSETSLNGQSRLTDEFEVLEELGKGAFGEVLKVKNKLDGRFYAIKKIKLNPLKKNLNRKIGREVMLLSRTLHENVVRYYNAWIETTTIKSDSEDDNSSVTTSPSTESKAKTNNQKVVRKNEVSLEEDLEKLGISTQNFEVSITYDSKSEVPFLSSSDDDSSSGEDSSSDEDEVLGQIKEHDKSESNSDSILFEKGSVEESESESRLSKKSDKPNLLRSAYLYIQMEFCEKSTLRTAIDNNLYLDDDRVWRLFREMVEGLAYIHQSGMIHRDLKPVNIFLDSHDHVKIGDFGLATTIALRSAPGDHVNTTEMDRDDQSGECKTGQVGTALYVAPEIRDLPKVVYNQKVDIYSLGIILFEMCHKPLKTGMERSKVLGNLRTKNIIFPDDFNKKNERAVLLIRNLLNHDTSKRPTSKELLQSPHIPPPVLEERKLQEMVRNTLSDPKLKSYQYLISSCFKQTLAPALDITYDKDQSSESIKHWFLYEYVREVCIKIFKKHGGEHLATPLLMPQSKFHENAESCVKVMTRFGNIVSIPHDLRVPFARHVAWYNITCLRRYSVEKIYEEKSVPGFMPREYYECAFDIVTPTPGNLLSDAEILYVIYEIVSELPGVKNKHFLIRLNHVKLLKSVLIHCGLKDRHEEVFSILVDNKYAKLPKHPIHNYLVDRGLPDNMITLLIHFLNSECEMSKLANHFQCITKKKSGAACSLAKEALHELKLIVQNAESYGLKFDIVVAPGLVYNVQQYSGMICEFSCDIKKRQRHNTREVIATGGRYDAMISYYRTMMEQGHKLTKDVSQSAVGVYISLDKLVQAVQQAEKEELPKMDPVVLIMSQTGSPHLIKETRKIQKCMWDIGIRCCVMDDIGEDEMQERVNDIKVGHVIILSEIEHGIARVYSCDGDIRERYQEKRYTISELLDVAPKMFKSGSENTAETMHSMVPISRSESKTNYVEKNEPERIVDVLFVTVEKLSSNTRKRYENQIRTQLEGLFKKLTGFIAVLGVNIEFDIITTLSCNLNFESESLFAKSTDTCIRKHQRHKKYLNDICDEIWSLKLKKTNPIIILYSLPNNNFRVIF